MEDSTEFVADPELLDELEKLSKPVRHTADRVLFRQGDPVAGLYVLHRGMARLTMRSSTGQMVLKIAVGSGSLLGLPAIISDRPYSLTAEVLETSEVAFVSRERFVDMIRMNPQLSLKVFQVLAAEVRAVRRALANR